jgi:hypothetical protein
MHRDESVNSRLPACSDRVEVHPLIFVIFEWKKVQPDTLDGREAIGSDALRKRRKGCQILEN